METGKRIGGGHLENALARLDGDTVFREYGRLDQKVMGVTNVFVLDAVN